MTKEPRRHVDSQIGSHRDSSRKLFLALIGMAVLVFAVAALAVTDTDRILYSDIISVLASGSALAFAIHVVYRQKLKGLFPRVYASLGLGLALWFIAEAIWAYYEVVEGIETPFPSIADAFWLAGYIPFFYFLVGILRNFLGISRSSFVPLFLASSVGIVLLANILFSTYQEADLTTPDGTLVFLVGSAYPVADMFLLVPAIAAFIQLKAGKLTFIPWATIVIAVILYIIGDTGFTYFVLGGLDAIVWVWNPFYQIGDLAIASSLFWHRKFFTIDEKKLMKQWQEKNR